MDASITTPPILSLKLTVWYANQTEERLVRDKFQIFRVNSYLSKNNNNKMEKKKFREWKQLN